MALTLNCVLHRQTLASVAQLIKIARDLEADTLELANTQDHGWALLNRAALMPTREQARPGGGACSSSTGESDRPTILFVLPDYYADRPKPCMGGGANRTASSMS